MSKVFFETIAVKKIDDETNLLFENWLTELVQAKLAGQPTASIQHTINRKLAQIYTLTDIELELINRSESADTDGDSSIINISELVRL